MPIPRPKKGLRWIFTQAPTYDILTVSFASLVGFASAANFAAQNRHRSAVAVGVATAVIWIATAVKQAIALTEARKKGSTHELEGCLHTLHAVLAPAAADPPATLRLAIHVPVGSMLEQVTEYIGVSPEAGRIGRQFSANTGIIGKAYRENQVLVARRVNDDYELYVQELVKDWNYTPEQARRLNPAVMAWMAVPFHSPERQRVDAILYLDANKRNFFSQERQEVILAAQSGIAVFVGKRYA